MASTDGGDTPSYNWVLTVSYEGGKVFLLGFANENYAAAVTANGTLTVSKEGSVIDTKNNFSIDGSTGATYTAPSAVKDGEGYAFRYVGTVEGESFDCSVNVTINPAGIAYIYYNGQFKQVGAIAGNNDGDGGDSSITVDTSMSSSSANPVRNSVIKAYVDGLIAEVSDLQLQTQNLL